MVEQSRRSHAEARRLYDECLEIENRLGNQSGAAKSLTQLGSLFEQEGELEAAEKYVLEALEIFTRIGEKPMQELASKHLARIREKLKKKNQGR